MGSDPDTTNTPVAGAASLFPRLELPPVPTFGRRTEDDEVAPLRDEPASTWAPPWPEPVDAEDRYRAMVERVAALAPQAAAAPALETPQTPADTEPASTPSPATPAFHMPELATEPPAPRRASSVPAIGLMLVAAALLAWASRMAFSPALLGMAALLLAQLAAAATTLPGAGRRPLLLGAGALIAALLAARGALHGFSEMAFVAGLFVIVAVAATLLLFGALQLVLRRRGDAASPLDLALRAGWKLRIGALVATLLAGVQAHRSFSAVPDAIVTFGIVAVVGFALLPVLRPASGGAGTQD